MCSPLAIAAGGLTAGGGILGAMAKHRQLQQQAARQNQIQKLEYENQLMIAQHKDQMKAQLYSKKLEAHAAAQSAVYRQMELNQQEANRASMVAQQQRKETATDLAFKTQEALVQSIQATGQTLSSGMNAGQSMLLQLMDIERQIGFKNAQLNATMYDANIAYGFKEYGNKLDQYSADMSAINSQPAAPVNQSASFLPVRKPDVQGPSGLGLLAGVVSSVGSGISTGIGTQVDINELG